MSKFSIEFDRPVPFLKTLTMLDSSLSILVEESIFRVLKNIIFGVQMAYDSLEPALLFSFGTRFEVPSELPSDESLAFKWLNWSRGSLHVRWI